ncbi:MAG: hypothetical protein ACE15E_10110 [Acidobacteriota bacterium]
MILRYPGLLAWEHLFHDGVREVYAMMRERLVDIPVEGDDLEAGSADGSRSTREGVRAAFRAGVDGIVI